MALPRATGGDGTLTYTLAPRPPAGLAFDAAGPRLHGTPTTGTPAATYTLTAHDADANAGDAATLRFTVAVVPNAPTFGVPSAAQRYVRNIAVDAASPTATGGDGALGYMLTGPGDSATLRLPSGSSFDASGPRIHGTPTGTAAEAVYTLTVHDADADRSVADAATLEVPLSVAAPDAPGVIATYFGEGGRDDYLYSLHPTTRSIGFSPPKRTIRYWVRFGKRVTVTGTPKLALDIGGVKRAASYHSASSFNSDRGAHLQFRYDVQAADSDGDGIDVTANALTLNGGTIRGADGVDADLRLTNISRCHYPGGGCARAANIPGMLVSGARPSFPATGVSLAATVGEAFDHSLPAASGGNVPLRYSLATTYTLTGPGTATTLRLPPGLRFDEATRVIVGTPTENRAAATYTLTAHDADDDTTDADAATQTFPIAVTGQPTFAAAAQTFVVTAGKAVHLALTAAHGGDGTLGYGVRPGLPRGLTFDAATRTITGTPATAQAATTYTYTATDTDGDAAHLAVSLRILAADAPTVTGLAFDPPVGVVAFYPGSQIVATVTFSEAVTVGTGGDRPQLEIDLDGTTRRMSYNSALSGPTLLFTYRVQTSDVDLDGLSVPRTALTLNGATIRAGALDANLDLGSHAFADRSTLKVNGRPRPVFGGTQAPLRFRQNVGDAFTLPAATGGEGALTYRLGATPALPGGLTYYALGATVRMGVTATGGGVIAGTPPHARPRRPIR